MHHYFNNFLPGPSRATARPGETFLRGPQTFSRGPSEEKIFEFFLSKWYILAYFINFWPTAGPPNAEEPGVTTSNLPYPTLSTGLLLAHEDALQVKVTEQKVGLLHTDMCT